MSIGHHRSTQENVSRTYLVFGLEPIDKLDNVWMIQALYHLDFSHNAGFIAFQDVLANYFDRH